MNKLWAFGCSLTFGHGLSDCFDGPKTNGAGPLPSIYSWPAVLANMFLGEGITAKTMVSLVLVSF